jgi:predicted NAD/FAD-dependent oxidoreductase
VTFIPAYSGIDPLMAAQKFDNINSLHLHRWRYANALKVTLAHPLMDVANQLAACGY